MIPSVLGVKPHSLMASTTRGLFLYSPFPSFVSNVLWLLTNHVVKA